MSMRTGRWLAMWILWATLPLGAEAQRGPAAGDRVRVRHVDGRELTGTLAGVSADRVRLLTAENEEQVVATDRIESLEWRVGEERRLARNMLLTVLGAAAVGGLVGAVAWEPCNETGFLACFLHPDSRADAFGQGLVVGGALGVPVGLLVGLAKKHDVWQPVALPGTDGPVVDVSPLVRTDGVGLAFSIPVGGF